MIRAASPKRFKNMVLSQTHERRVAGWLGKSSLGRLDTRRSSFNEGGLSQVPPEPLMTGKGDQRIHCDAVAAQGLGASEFWQIDDELSLL
nr:hypothetical protein [Tanacetum cinerariifolium]